MTSKRSVQSVAMIRVEGADSRAVTDRVAVERALEVRLHGEPFSVIMRTPGEDRALALGFLASEGVIRSAVDVASVVEAADDRVDVTLSADRAPVLDEVLASRRNVSTNSSCGMCGRRTLESLDVPGLPLPYEWTVPPTLVAALPTTLAGVQRAFAETGGLHAAGLFDLDGALERVAEDVGRHNAVDKLVGHMMLVGRLPLGRSILAVSGRLSFEIVQKAWLAGVPFVAAVSAPSSLAIELAARAGMTTAAFVRDGRFNVYTGIERIS